MTTKKATKTAPARSVATAEDLARQAKTKADDDQFVARVATDGTVNCALVAQYLPELNGGVSPQALSIALPGQVKAIASGDLTQLETMLLSQATALQAMFVDLAGKARVQTNREWMQLHSTLALKCAAGSRQAIVALAELRMPKSVLFSKQTNVSSGPQQVNNNVNPPAAIPRAREFQDRPIRLLEAQHENHLDTRAAGKAGSADPHLATVGTLDRADDSRR